ncbi:hypothetical protein Malapachy_1617 [Malassezia pachydermatis]|uniref:Uncharacterized protein n=1 Tax=Malassezia pachydermatis TaxID=77020 RepID=A0A0M8MK70_9BASI|nr:hypothetical protein Malapachy_1617 [Malassezia pachydermatis]KOS13208.1 hypothetical protein Malapachy_1617 [Malassezia pachydermatis]
MSSSKTIQLGDRTLEEHAPYFYIDRPVPLGSASSMNAPDVVMLFGWMDAELRYVYKYAEKYRGMFPHAHVMIILSSYESCFVKTGAAWRESSALIQKELASIADERMNHGSTTSTVVHCFSNGGMIQYSAFASHLNYEAKNFPVPVATILDSSPGYGELSTLLGATLMRFTGNTWLDSVKRLGVRAFVSAVHFLHVGLSLLGPDTNNIEWMRRVTNKCRLWAWRSKDDVSTMLPPRLYLHTEADVFIKPEAVSQHAEDAQKTNHQGPPAVIDMERTEGPVSWPPLSTVRTRRACWTTPKHCAIGRTFHDQYWSLVQSFLQEVSTLPNAPKASKL